MCGSAIGAILESLRKVRIRSITRRATELIVDLLWVQEERLRYTISWRWFELLFLFGTAHRALICMRGFLWKLE